MRRGSRFGVWDPHENPGADPRTVQTSRNNATNLRRAKTDNVGGSTKQENIIINIIIIIIINDDHHHRFSNFT